MFVLKTWLKHDKPWITEILKWLPNGKVWFSVQRPIPGYKVYDMLSFKQRKFDSIMYLCYGGNSFRRPETDLNSQPSGIWEWERAIADGRWEMGDIPKITPSPIVRWEIRTSVFPACLCSGVFQKLNCLLKNLWLLGYMCLLILKNTFDWIFRGSHFHLTWFHWVNQYHVFVSWDLNRKYALLSLMPAGRSHNFNISKYFH